MHCAEHFFSLNLERYAFGYGAGSGRIECACVRERLFSDEVPRGEKRDGGFFAIPRSDGQLCAATFEIEDIVRGFSLRQEDLPFAEFDDSAPKPVARQKGFWIERGLLRFMHLRLSAKNVPATWQE